MNTTVRMKASDITKDWHVLDAAGRPLGRIASEAAVLLRGKHKPTFEPHLDGGDFVIIVNASQVKVTGRKAEQIKYHRHSGYPGGLRTRSYTEQFTRFPERVVEQAVWGMLPDGPLGKAMLRHLKVYRGAKHPHESQVVGSERARTAREAAVQAALGTPMKAPRLRPLSVPQPDFITPEAEAAIDAPPPAPKRAPRKVAETALGADQSSAAADAVLEPGGVVEAAEAPVAEAPDEAPKRRTRRKVDEPAAEGEAPTKPARAPRRPAAATESAEASTEESAPKRTRRKAASESEE